MPETAGGKFARLITKLEGNTHTTLALVALVLLCWLPYYVFFFPGNLSNDTTGQLAWFMEVTKHGFAGLSDHHPVFDTLVFGAIFFVFSFGGLHLKAGVAACIAIQLVATAWVLTASLLHARDVWRVPRHLIVLLYGAVCFFPLFPLLACSLSKDSFFSWIYVLFLTDFIDLALVPDKMLGNRRWLIQMLVESVLLSLTKKLGVYIVVGTLALTTILLARRYKKSLLLLIPAMTSGLLVWAILPSIYAAVGIVPGGKQEMLAVPMQQTAVAYFRHGDEMSGEELQIIDESLDLDTLGERFGWLSADGSKNYALFQGDAIPYRAYVSLWANQAFKYPGAYLDAWANLMAPLFGWEKVLPLFNSKWHTWAGTYFPDDFYIKPGFCETASLGLGSVYSCVSNIPVLDLFFTETFPVFIVPLLVFGYMMKGGRDRRHFIVLIPIVLSIGGLMASPMVYLAEGMRYVMPFIYTAPIILAFCQYPDE